MRCWDKSVDPQEDRCSGIFIDMDRAEKHGEIAPIFLNVVVEEMKDGSTLFALIGADVVIAPDHSTATWTREGGKRGVVKCEHEITWDSPVGRGR